ncbi:GIY-YIG nuclease family protein [Candidatus Kuenenbacteria bacterium]|nr:GIY-YIG nuclease family protein [Candidatus Kuenenbacteria bacterium]
MEFIVYCVYNKKHNKIYIGQTKNLEERLALHNNKIFSKGYTARFDGEWVAICLEHVASREEALKREKELKSYRGRQFIKGFIRG